MIDRKDVLSLAFYEKMPFKGSYGNMRYLIQKKMSEEDGKQLEVITWPGPLCFEATDDDLKVSEIHAFSEEGMQEIIDYLNQRAGDF